MKINLKQLKTFSKCPMAFCLSLKGNKEPEITEQERIIGSVISKGILQIMETSYRADWRKIVSWVDKEVFKNCNIYCSEQYSIAKKSSEYILLAMGAWYDQIYLQWSTEAFTNVPLGVETAGIFVEGRAPVINLRNPIVCTQINTNAYGTKKEHFNDIETRALAWLVSEHLNCTEVTMQCLSIGKRGKLDINIIKYDKNSLIKTGRYINNICRIIKRKLYYPSITNECIECKFYEKCNP